MNLGGLHIAARSRQHCSEDPQLWRFLEGELPLVGIILVGDRPQLLLWLFHMCDTGHSQGQEPGFSRCMREWRKSLHCTKDEAVHNQLLGKFLEEMLQPCGLEVRGALCTGF